MKISFVLMFVLAIQASASVYSQNAKLDLSVTEMKVKDVLKLIESKSNFRFFYNDELSDLDKTQTLSTTSGNISEVLSQLFANSNISYKVFENNVVVIAPAVSLQQQQITGIVTDGVSGEPLIGVNITVEGTTRGVVTDADGKFIIEAQSPEAILVFTYVGYVAERITVGSQSKIDVKLIPDITSLDEVVVIGYGTVKKRDLTGSVGSVKSEDIVKAPTSNAIEAIQGKVTGVDIIRSSGKAGSGVTMRVRGNRSFGNPTSPNSEEIFENLNKPLFIIDGIQGASYTDLNPNDIESIEVLKDASTTAIYGWQGANGVVIITTKKASAGKTKVSYNGYYGVNGLTAYPKGRTGNDYIQFRRDAYRGRGWNSEADDPAIFPNGEWEAIQNNQWTDWTDLLLDNGTMQSHQLSVSGGNEKTSTYFSVGYYNEVGAIKDEFTKYNARFNTDHKFAKWLKTGLQAQLTYLDQDQKKDALSKANSMSPIATPYDENGNLILYPIVGDNSLISPLTDTRKNAAVNNQISTKVFAAGYLELTPIKGLTFRSNLGVNLSYNRQGIFNDSLSLTQFADGRNKASIKSTNNRNYVFDNILTYTKDIADHSFTLTGLTSYTESVSDYVSAEGYDQAYSSNLFYNLASADPTTQKIYSGYTGSKTISYAGRLNYSFKGRYLITATERTDGSTRLASGHKWSWFPSVAAAWRVSEEGFMRDLNFINNFKLRFSYGEAGNAAVAEYGTQSGVVANSMVVAFDETLVPTYVFKNEKASNSLEWERSATYNTGFDLGLFKDRLNIEFDRYITKTTGVLMLRPLPISNGGPKNTPFTIWQNIGESQNKGIEVTINSANVQSGNFKWTSTLTFSRNKEKIVKLIDGQNIISSTNSEDYSLLLGHPIRSFYNYEKLGIWQTSDTAHLAILKNNLTPGDIKLADLNNDSAFDAAHDRTYIGSTVPDWVCGLQNTFTYKGIDLSVYLFARWGQMIKNELLGRYNPSGTGNGPAYLDYWTPENPTNDFPAPRSGENLANYLGYMTLPYVDGSYFKIKNITLGYTLPKKLSSKILIEKFRVYVTASNILTVAKSHLIKYYDPENGGSETTPMSRQIIIGANVYF